MESRQDHWESWARYLHHYELEKPAAFILDAAGPLTILLAQAVSLGEPLLGASQSRAGWEALADMLEDPAQAKAFAKFLKEERFS